MPGDGGLETGPGKGEGLRSGIGVVLEAPARGPAGSAVAAGGMTGEGTGRPVSAQMRPLLTTASRTTSPSRDRNVRNTANTRSSPACWPRSVRRKSMAPLAPLAPLVLPSRASATGWAGSRARAVRAGPRRRAEWTWLSYLVPRRESDARGKAPDNTGAVWWRGSGRLRCEEGMRVTPLDGRTARGSRFLPFELVLRSLPALFARAVPPLAAMVRWMRVVPCLR